MNGWAILRKSLMGSPLVAATAYAAVLLVLLWIVVSSIADILSQRAAVAASAAMLEQLDGRRIAPPKGSAAGAGMPSGSPFLEGATVTVAGAALLQRVAGAVTRFGGNVLSSQLDVQGPHAKAGFVSMIASCELDQPTLQPLLYDLEAGMPFLFVDQLSVQAASSGEGKLRVLLSVSAQWQGAK